MYSYLLVLHILRKESIEWTPQLIGTLLIHFEVSYLIKDYITNYVNQLCNVLNGGAEEKLVVSSSKLNKSDYIIIIDYIVIFDDYNFL